MRLRNYGFCKNVAFPGGVAHIVRHHSDREDATSLLNDTQQTQNDRSMTSICVRLYFIHFFIMALHNVLEKAKVSNFMEK